MSLSRSAYLDLLADAFIEIRAVIAMREPHDYAKLCADIVDIVQPIPSALLDWSRERAPRLHSEIVDRASHNGRLRILNAWLPSMEDIGKEAPSASGLLEQPTGVPSTRYSQAAYIKLMQAALDRMSELSENLPKLQAYADTFHNVPYALQREWTEEHARQLYEEIRERAEGYGIWDGLTRVNSDEAIRK